MSRNLDFLCNRLVVLGAMGKNVSVFCDRIALRRSFHLYLRLSRFYLDTVRSAPPTLRPAQKCRVLADMFVLLCGCVSLLFVCVTLPTTRLLSSAAFPFSLLSSTTVRRLSMRTHCKRWWRSARKMPVLMEHPVDRRQRSVRQWPEPPRKSYRRHQPPQSIPQIRVPVHRRTK